MSYKDDPRLKDLVRMTRPENINLYLLTVTKAIEKWIYKNSKQYLLFDKELQDMLSQLLYWDKHLKNEYSKDRQKKLNTLDNLFSAMEDLGMKFINSLL